MTKGLSFIIIAAVMSLSVATSEARTLHHPHRYLHHARIHTHHRHVAFHDDRRHVAYRHRHGYRHVAHRNMSPSDFRNYRAYASFATPTDLRARVGRGSDPVAIAERYLGSNPTNHRTLWCADFANFVLRKANRVGTGSRLAMSFLSLPGTRPHYGAIAVMGRRGGGHVGFVAGFDRSGNPIIISGNSRGHRVAMSVYNRHRIIKYVSPV